MIVSPVAVQMSVLPRVVGAEGAGGLAPVSHGGRLSRVGVVSDALALLERHLNAAIATLKRIAHNKLKANYRDRKRLIKILHS